MPTITFVTEDEDGNETLHELPARYEVCPRCDGEGYHLTPSIGQHAYSMEEFHEAFNDEEDVRQYMTRGGIYDVVCEECEGRNVVPVPDESRCDPAALKLYEKQLRDEAECRREQRYAERMGY